MYIDKLPSLVSYIFFYKVKWGKKGLLGRKRKILNRILTKELNLSVGGTVFPEIIQQVKSNEDGFLAMVSTTTIVMC